MDFEQIVKRLQWLDEEHRKDKAAIIELEERVTAYGGNVDTIAKQIKPLEKQISSLAPNSARIDQFQGMLSKQREEMKQTLDEIEQKYLKREKDLIKQHQNDLESLNKEFEQIKKPLSEIATIKHDLKARVTEENRLHQELKDIKPSIDDAIRAAGEATRTQRVFEENRKQDMKRLSDLQGEITALRKRIDDAGTKAETGVDSIKHLEKRFKELMVSETERKAAQNEFIEKQSVAQVDRDRAYKEWVNSYTEFQKQVEKLDSQTQTLEETLRAAKRAQETYNELNTKLERRINEVSEMQRLAEDRLRQEWVTFRADDQKRWTGYTLSQDEGIKDFRKSLEKMEERFNVFSESHQTMQDQLHQTTDATEKQLQELMNVAHEWLSAYERIMGHGKSTKKTKK
ncbi:MAG TPA: hypothetical protein DCX53_00320 [Anaerolineae bacterium]|nr:hypothetical protein [Anaerolineae bacterium]